MSFCGGTHYIHRNMFLNVKYIDFWFSCKEKPNRQKHLKRKINEFLKLCSIYNLYVQPSESQGLSFVSSVLGWQVHIQPQILLFLIMCMCLHVCSVCVHRCLQTRYLPIDARSPSLVSFPITLSPIFGDQIPQ